MSHDQMQTRNLVHHLADVWLCFFRLASSHHHLDMNFYHIFLLLLVVLSAYSESPQYAKPPDSPNSIGVTICPNSSSAQLGILAPVLPQNEVYKTVLPQNGVFRTILPQNEVLKSVLPQDGVFRTILPQNEVFKIVLPQTEVLKSVPISSQLFKEVNAIMETLLNVGARSFQFLTSTMMPGGEKLGWGIRNLFECLQHAIKML